MNISSSDLKTGTLSFSNLNNNGFSWSNLCIIIIFVVVLLGVAMRLWIYFSGLPVRYDEIRLALNVIDRPYPGLLEPLIHQQSGAPLGFMFTSKLIVDLLGESELSLRLLPLLTSIAGLCVFGYLVHRYVGTAGDIVAISIVSLSPILIFFANDFKQYSLDFFMTSVFLLIAFSWIKGFRTSRSWYVMTGVGALCLFFSHPAVFYVGAVSAILLINPIAKKDKKNIIKLLPTLTIWLIVLITVYWFNLRYSKDQTFIQLYFSNDFLPTDSVSSAVRWLVFSPLRMTNYFGFPFGLTTQIGLVFISLVGAISLLQREPKIGFTLLLIIFLTWLAAILQIYPFYGRLIIFLSPVFLILMAEGVNRIVITSGWPQILLVIMCVSSLLPLTISRFETFSWTRGRVDMPSVIEYLGNHLSKNEQVILEKRLSYPYNFYKRQVISRFDVTFIEIPKGEKLSPESASSTLMTILNKKSASNGIWLVVPDRRVVRRGHIDNPSEIVRVALEKLGLIVDVAEFNNVTVYHISGQKK